MNNVKPSYRRKRIPRKNYKKRKPRYFKKFKKTSYDGAVYVKVFNLDAVYYKTTYEGYFVTGWGQSGTSTDNVRTIDDNLEFQDYVTMYKQWRLIGLKMKFTPVQQVTSASSSFIGAVQVATDTDGNFGPSTPETSLQRCIDYRTYYGSYKRYYKCGKYYAKKNQKWLTTGSYYNGVNTMMRVATSGYSNDNIIGYMETTYYCMFKSQ